MVWAASPEKAARLGFRNQRGEDAVLLFRLRVTAVQQREQRARIGEGDDPQELAASIAPPLFVSLHKLWNS